MSRSRLVFFGIIGGGLILVVLLSVVIPALQPDPVSVNATRTASAFATARANQTTIRLTYGTEKETWLKEAKALFEQQNPNIVIDLLGEGSMESYFELSKLTDAATQYKRAAIPTLYAPASEIQINLLNKTGVTGRDLAIECKDLVLSPNVIMIWEDRAQVLETAYKGKGGVTFKNIAAALDTPDPKEPNNAKLKGKWVNIGGSADWGYIKVGHTNPNQSNSGISTLITLTNNYFEKTTPFTGADLNDPGFTKYLATIENAVITTSLPNSTGVFAREFINKGPGAYDVAFVYEALAIEYYKAAFTRWGQGLRIIYPPYNLYTDNPMCILDHPAVTPIQRDAGRRFQQFLLTTDIQKLALKSGWRPSDLTIGIFGSQPPSPFDDTDIKNAGVGVNVGQEIRLPDGQILQSYLNTWNWLFRVN
jgi:hypothetical protein